MHSQVLLGQLSSLCNILFISSLLASSIFKMQPLSHLIETMLTKMNYSNELPGVDHHLDTNSTHSLKPIPNANPILPQTQNLLLLSTSNHT